MLGQENEENVAWTRIFCGWLSSLLVSSTVKTHSHDCLLLLYYLPWAKNLFLLVSNILNVEKEFEPRRIS